MTLLASIALKIVPSAGRQHHGWVNYFLSCGLKLECSSFFPADRSYPLSLWGNDSRSVPAHPARKSTTAESHPFGEINYET